MSGSGAVSASSGGREKRASLLLSASQETLGPPPPRHRSGNRKCLEGRADTLCCAPFSDRAVGGDAESLTVPLSLVGSLPVDPCSFHIPG